MVNKVLFHKWLHDATDVNNQSYVTHGDKSCTQTNEINCNQYKPSISVFICDTETIKDNKIHEGDTDETEHRFNSQTYTLSAGAVGMMLHIYGNFTTWRLKSSLIKMVSFKLWSRSSCISGMLVQIQGNRCNQKSQWTLNYSVKQYHLYSGIKGPGCLHYFGHF